MVSVTSKVCVETHGLGQAMAALRNPSSFRSEACTRAPAARSACASENPIPEAAPVISTILLLKIRLSIGLGLPEITAILLLVEGWPTGCTGFTSRL